MLQAHTCTGQPFGNSAALHGDKSSPLSQTDSCNFQLFETDIPQKLLKGYSGFFFTWGLILDRLSPVSIDRDQFQLTACSTEFGQLTLHR